MTDLVDRVEPLFHIVDRTVWEQAVTAGEYRPESLTTDGFVHLSFADQVAGTAERFYKHVPDLVVIEVDPAQLPTPIVVEDLYGHGAAFPHLYGPVPVAAVVAVRPLMT